MKGKRRKIKLKVIESMKINEKEYLSEVINQVKENYYTDLELQEFLIKNNLLISNNEKDELLKIINKERKIFIEHIDIPFDIEDKQEIFINQIDRTMLLNQIKELESKYVCVILLIYFNGYSYRRCAETLEVNERTIRRWVKCALEELKQKKVLIELYKSLCQ